MCVIPCTASDECHILGVCDVNTGICSNPVAVGTECDDGNANTVNDKCDDSGNCAGEGK